MVHETVFIRFHRLSCQGELVRSQVVLKQEGSPSHDPFFQDVNVFVTVWNYYVIVIIEEVYLALLHTHCFGYLGELFLQYVPTIENQELFLTLLILHDENVTIDKPAFQFPAIHSQVRSTVKCGEIVMPVMSIKVVFLFRSDNGVEPSP